MKSICVLGVHFIVGWSWASDLSWMPMLVFSASTPLSKYFMTLSNVSKQDNIMR